MNVLLNALILLVVAAAAAVLFSPRVANLTLWRASITPLASIIGSGFLVLGPILGHAFGAWAPLIMLALCALAYAFGAAIRFNITRIETCRECRSRTEEGIEAVASWALTFAYIISVAYYLNLLGTFSVSLTMFDTDVAAKLVTTAVFVLILVVGYTRGFATLERMEQVSVGIKLAIVVGLLFGLGWFSVTRFAQGEATFEPARVTGWPALMLVAGLLVTVQGFETSRYLGHHYDAATRKKSMRLAQGLSAAIYLIYVVLITYTLHPGGGELSETEIIDMVSVVAAILPLLLVAAAISAQFSAAVADTSGSGGLIAELTNDRVPARQGYALLVFVGLLLTWFSSIFDIISYASRAFALYYGLQAIIAMCGAAAEGDKRRMFAFLVLGITGLACVVFGTSVE